MFFIINCYTYLFVITVKALINLNVWSLQIVKTPLPMARGKFRKTFFPKLKRNVDTSFALITRSVNNYWLHNKTNESNMNKGEYGKRTKLGMTYRWDPSWYLFILLPHPLLQLCYNKFIFSTHNKTTFIALRRYIIYTGSSDKTPVFNKLRLAQVRMRFL